MNTSDPRGQAQVSSDVRLDNMESSLSKLTTMIKSLSNRKHSTRRKRKHRRKRSTSSDSSSSRKRRREYSRGRSISRYGTSATSSVGRSRSGSASGSDLRSTSDTRLIFGATSPSTSDAQNLSHRPGVSIKESIMNDSSNADLLVTNEDRAIGNQNTTSDVIQDSLEIHIDEETKKLLGAPPKQSNKFGPKFHSEIQQRWSALRTSGMLKEERSKIQEEYAFPPNCELGGPKLNPELVKVIPSFAKDKDEDLRRVQDHVAVSLSALGQALTNAVQKPETYNRNDMLQHVSDAGRYLMGTQYFLSSLRRKLVKSTIKDSDMKDLLDKSQITSNLFGEDLAAQVKTAQALAKTSRDIAGSGPLKDTTKALESAASTSKRAFATQGRPAKPNTRDHLNYNRPPTKRSQASPKRWSGRPRLQRTTRK